MSYYTNTISLFPPCIAEKDSGTSRWGCDEVVECLTDPLPGYLLYNMASLGGSFSQTCGARDDPSLHARL